MNILKKYYIAYILAVLPLIGICQGGLNQREKLFLHFDKNEYVLGDTMWFKSYLVDALLQTPSQKSGIEYVELIDENKNVIKRFSYHLVLGTTFGEIAIDTSYFIPGTYKIRAYTNWMQNFGDSLFYEREITIADIRNYSKWFLTMQHPSVHNDSVVTSLHFTDEKNQPQRFKVIDFYLLARRRRTILKDQLQLDENGAIEVNFNIPQKFRDMPLSIKVTDANNKWAVRLDVPFDLLNKDADIQFLPESGHLVAGMENTVGFKAVGADGTGKDISGRIIDNAGDRITSFKSIYKGMGILSFTPQADKTYAAVLTNGRTVALPKVENTGTILHVKSGANDDNVQLQIKATKDLAGKQYYIMAKAKDFVVYKAKVVFKDKDIVTDVPKTAFPTGVASFVLQDATGQIVNERSFFVDNKDQLNIKIKTAKTFYHPRDSIPVTITVTDKQNKPVVGTFSLAVTDNDQAAKNENTDENILSYFLLQSDIQGNIETPNYYFSNNADSTKQALDALMLTQGFVRYDWDTTKFKYKAEPEYTISGKVVKGLKGNKPIVGTNVTLLATKKFQLIRQAATDNDGRFSFTGIPNFDTCKFVVEAKNARNKNWNVSLLLDTFHYPETKSVQFDFDYAGQLNIDSTLLKTAQYKSPTYLHSIAEPGQLEDVIVTTKAKIPGSHNLNGSGNADQVITQEQISKVGNFEIFQLLKKIVPGFIPPLGDYVIPKVDIYKADHTLLRHGPLVGLSYGKIEDRPVYLYIDGEQLTDAKGDEGSNFHLEYLKAQDIKGIEVLTNDKRIYKYDASKQYYILNGSYIVPKPVFIEITTISGAGVGIVRSSSVPGVELVRPNIFYYGKSFYMPKYNKVDTQNVQPDLRSTIYWNPTVVTNEKGEAKVYFYAADPPVNYTICVEGMDLKGYTGYQYKQLKIEHR